MSQTKESNGFIFVLGFLSGITLFAGALILFGGVSVNNANNVMLVKEANIPVCFDKHGAVWLWNEATKHSNVIDPSDLAEIVSKLKK